MARPAWPPPTTSASTVSTGPFNVPTAPAAAMPPASGDLLERVA